MFTKRALMKAAAGATAAIATQDQQGISPTPYPRPPLGPIGDLHRYADENVKESMLEDPIISAARRAFQDAELEKRNIRQRELDLRIEAIQEMRSVSPAYVRYRRRQLWEEHNRLDDAFHKAIRDWVFQG